MQIATAVADTTALRFVATGDSLIVQHRDGCLYMHKKKICITTRNRVCSTGDQFHLCPAQVDGDAIVAMAMTWERLYVLTEHGTLYYSTVLHQNVRLPLQSIDWLRWGDVRIVRLAGYDQSALALDVDGNLHRLVSVVQPIPPLRELLLSLLPPLKDVTLLQQTHILQARQQQRLQLQQVLQQPYALPATEKLGPIVSMACGDGNNHCLVVTQQNKVYGHGACTHGVLGLGFRVQYCAGWTEIPLPPDDSGEADVRCTAVACGPQHTLLLRSNGTLLGTGNREKGRLGLVGTGSVRQFEKIPLDDRICAIACGRQHSVALSRQGKLYVTGSNQWGQLALEQAVTQLNAFTLCASLDRPVLEVACGNYATIVTTALGLWVAGLNVGSHTEYLFRQEKSLAGFKFITDKQAGHDGLSVRSSPQQKRAREEAAEKAVVATVSDRHDDAASLLVSLASSPVRGGGGGEKDEPPVPLTKKPRIMSKQKPV
jgi:alpha-tubulin suppressor-like RCC1 family protein